MNEGVSKKLVSKRTLEHWYRAYTPLLHYKLRNLGLNTHEREDIVSETWLKILRSGYDGSGVFASYLTSIATNAGIDHLRHQKRTKTEVLDHVAHPESVFDHVAIECTRSALRFMCLQLSLSQQMAYITIQYAGIPYSEASRMLDAPVPTLKTRIRRATALLREPARYSTYPCSIALPVGYAPVQDGAWRMLVQEDQEYTLFTRDSETSVLEVTCRYESA